jgi:hypothetical protein
MIANVRNLFEIIGKIEWDNIFNYFIYNEFQLKLNFFFLKKRDMDGWVHVLDLHTKKFNRAKAYKVWSSCLEFLFFLNSIDNIFYFLIVRTLATR